MGKHLKILLAKSISVFSAALLVCIAATTCGLPGRSKKETPIPIADTTVMDKPLIDSVKRISIVFAGDLMQHLPQIEAAMKPDSTTYDFMPCFRYIAPFFRANDLVVVNLETTLSDTSPYSGYPAFCAPSQLAADIKESGVDAVLLANNHICDKGGKGIQKTVAALDSVGLYHTGAFADSAGYVANNPLRISRNGFRISILNYTYGTNGLPVPAGRLVNLIDTAAMARDLALIEPDDNGITFVCLHWGEEYVTRPNNQQKMLAQWLGSKGVDFIVGGHPHVIQPIETKRDTAGRFEAVTIYSLGNFVSNQSRLNTDGGMVVRLEITKKTGQPVDITPEHFFVWTYRPWEKGAMRYYVIPSYDADSLLRDDKTDALKVSGWYADRARKILGGDHGFTEITGFNP